MFDIYDSEEEIHKQSFLNGTEFYTNIRGEAHRIDGPAYISPKTNSEAWYFKGKLHRLDGPAWTTTICKSWYKMGELHRENGPAIIYSTGQIYYYLNGEFYEKDEFYSLMFDSLSEEQQISFIFEEKDNG